MDSTTTDMFQANWYVPLYVSTLSMKNLSRSQIHLEENKVQSFSGLAADRCYGTASLSVFDFNRHHLLQFQAPQPSNINEDGTLEGGDGFLLTPQSLCKGFETFLLE